MPHIKTQRELLDDTISKRAEERGHVLTPSEQLSNYRKAMIEEERAEYRAIENARNDAKALWALADSFLPPDIREFGLRQKIPEFASEVWRHAFIAGWRAALRGAPMNQTGDER